jgi:hypothetical protein
MRLAIALAGIVVLIFGVLCLNYTNAWGLEHHTAVARERGWPEPSRDIYNIGIGGCVVGGAMVGLALRWRRRAA